MTNELFEDNAKQPEPVEAAPQTRTKLLEGVEALEAALDCKCEAKPTLDDLLGRTDEEIAAVRHRVIGAVTLALHGVARPTVPTIEIQLRNFRLWQTARGSAYFEWPDDAMIRLRAALQRYGEGVELLPAYAHSVGVRLHSGEIIFIDRDGKSAQK